MRSRKITELHCLPTNTDSFYRKVIPKHASSPSLVGRTWTLGFWTGKAVESFKRWVVGWGLMDHAHMEDNSAERDVNYSSPAGQNKLKREVA